MRKSDNKIFSTKQHEGKERAHAFVSVIAGKTHATFLAHSWGIMDGIRFFDTADDQHIELHGEFNFILHVPAQGATFDINGQLRELRAIERLVEIVN